MLSLAGDPVKIFRKKSTYWHVSRAHLHDTGIHIFSAITGGKGGKEAICIFLKVFFVFVFSVNFISAYKHILLKNADGRGSPKSSLICLSARRVEFTSTINLL